MAVMSAMANLLLAGVLRLVVSHHTTFFINSLAHFWGRRPYTEENTARDNDVLALLTYGEGYHNFHHLFQNDYRNGIRWWQFDPTKWLIKLLSWVGLTSDLKRTSSFKIREAMVNRQRQLTRAKLATQSQAEEIRLCVEKEYAQLMECLQEWKSPREKWYAEKRDSLIEAKQSIQTKWREHYFRTRFKELEYTLKLQQKRLHALNLQLA